MNRTQQAGRLAWLDYLRFSAALAVVAFHWLYLYEASGTIENLPASAAASAASYGYLGVHLFFLISGFVISNSAQGATPATFAVKRAVRLYPAFWAAVLFTSAMFAIWGTAEKQPSIPQVVVNLTMIPATLGQPLVDPSYWTLFHELCFYALVAALLFGGQAHNLDDILTGWAYTLLAIALLAPNTYYLPLCGAMYSLFAGGAILSAVQRKGWSAWRAGGLAAAVATSAVFVIRTTAHREIENHASYSVPATVVIVGTFYLLIAAQTRLGFAALTLPGSSSVAALTYPVYLIHHATGFVILYHFGTPANVWWLYPLTFALMLGVAQTVHVVVEQRLHRAWQSLFGFAVGRPIAALTRTGAPRTHEEPVAAEPRP